MAEKPLDPELQAMLKGIEVPDEDVEVVREIGAGPGAPKSLADAAAAVADWTNTGPLQDRKYSTDERPPLERARRKRTTIALVLLVVAFAGVVGFRFFRKPPPELPSDPIAFVAVLAPIAASGPAMAPQWSAPRGASDSLSERGLGVRIGALLVEYERAELRGDSTSQVSGDAISALLANLPDGVDIAATYASGGVEARSSNARHALAPFVRAAPMSLGGWLQAARIATRAGDAGFFASKESRGELARLLALRGASPEVEAARDRLETLLRRRGRPDFAAVADALETVQRELAN